MKLVYFNDFTLGVVRHDHVVDVSSAVQGIPHLGPHDLMTGLIERWDEYRGSIEKVAEASQGLPLSQVRLRAPVPRPGKMLCMAGNFMESGTLAEPRPINAFLKSPTTVIGQGDTVVIPSASATIFEHEAELGLVMGKTASHVKASAGYDHIFGYVNFIDVSARGLGSPPMDSFYPGKSWHTFCPMGPYLVTADEISDPQNLKVRLWINDELRQEYPTSDMAQTIPEIIEWASRITVLDPGDIFACGTNHRGLSPLQDGDVMEMEVEGLGRIRVNVKDALKREWPRLTRAEKEAQETTRAAGSS